MLNFRRKATAALATAAFMTFGAFATNLDAQSITRTLPDTYAAGGSIEVTIEADPGSSDIWGVEEFVPQGWTVSNIRINGSAAGSGQAAFVERPGAAGAVNIGPFFDADARTFSYEATAPSDASGSVTFGDGRAQMETTEGSFPIGGDSTIEAEGPALPVPTITQHPQSQEVGFGQSVTLSVTAESETDVTYQWQRNGANIEGANDSSYTITSASESDAGDYRVRVTNEHGTTTSNVATITVDVPELLPRDLDITIGPAESDLLAESRIFALADTYNYTIGEDDVDIVLTQDARGRISGSGTMGGANVDVNGVVRRLGTASDPLHRVNLVLRTENGSTILDQNLEVDAAGSRLVGTSRARGEADSADIEIPITTDGSWSIDIDTDASGEGTATINVDGEQIVYDASAGQSPAHNNRTIVTLRPTQSNGAGALRVDLDSDDDVVLVMGRVNGQALNAR